MLRFLILTVSWWAVLQVRRYLLMSGLGNSVPSKCFSPKVVFSFGEGHLMLGILCLQGTHRK